MVGFTFNLSPAVSKEGFSQISQVTAGTISVVPKLSCLWHPTLLGSQLCAVHV